MKALKSKNTIIKKPYLVQPVKYDGPENFTVSICIERPAVLANEIHPIHFERNELHNKKAQESRKEMYCEFFEYAEAYKNSQKKDTKDKKKQKEGSEVIVPPSTPKTEEKIKEYIRNEGASGSLEYNQYFLTHFKTMPIDTLSDQEDNRRSLDRKLTQRLYLIVKEKGQSFYKFPEMKRENPDHFARTAEKCMWRECSLPGKNMSFSRIVSNAPMSYYSVKKGDITFFYHFALLAGLHDGITHVFLEKLKGDWYQDYQWVTRQELLEYQFVTPKYQDTLYKMCYDGLDTYE